MHQDFKVKLGLVKKRIHMTKLTEENQRILKRIQEVPPAYNHMQWEEEADRLDRLKRTMALYPEYYERLDKDKDKERIKMMNEGGMSPGREYGGGSGGGGGGYTNASSQESFKMMGSKSGSLPTLPKIKHHS